MKIKGDQVYLVKNLSEDCFRDLLKWFTDIEVMKYISFAKRTLKFKDVDEAKFFTKELKDTIFFKILTKEGKSIGYTTLSRFKGKDECEFGILIGDKNYWGKGIGEEASKLTLEYGFNTLKLKKIKLSTSEFHKSAIKLYKKIGFKVFEIKKDARIIYHNKEWIKSDTVLMEISSN